MYKKAIFRQNWGFNLAYQNCLKITGSKREIEANFIFSKKNIDSGVIKVKNKNKIKKKYSFITSHFGDCLFFPGFNMVDKKTGKEKVKRVPKFFTVFNLTQTEELA